MYTKPLWRKNAASCTYENVNLMLPHCWGSCEKGGKDFVLNDLTVGRFPWVPRQIIIHNKVRAPELENWNTEGNRKISVRPQLHWVASRSTCRPCRTAPIDVLAYHQYVWVSRLPQQSFSILTLKCRNPKPRRHAAIQLRGIVKVHTLNKVWSNEAPSYQMPKTQHNTRDTSGDACRGQLLRNWRKKPPVISFAGSRSNSIYTWRGMASALRV